MALTQADLDEIEELVKEIIEEQTKHLPSKDLFLEWMDKLMGRLDVILKTKRPYFQVIPRITQID